MSITRRFFLVGAGSIITASFIRDAVTHIGDTRGEPLLIAPPEGHRTIYYEPCEDYWRLHLGTPQFEPPEPPLWIDYLRGTGVKLDTQRQIDRYCEQNWFYEEDLYSQMDGFGWEDVWEHTESSEAQAFLLLRKRGLFPSLAGYEREGRIVFQQFPNPMSSARWVEVHDPLSLSLLQARLNELDMAISLRPA